MDTARESAQEADSRRKIPCRNRDSNPRSYGSWLFSPTLYQLSYPAPYKLNLLIKPNHAAQPISKGEDESRTVHRTNGSSQTC